MTLFSFVQKQLARLSFDNSLIFYIVLQKCFEIRWKLTVADCSKVLDIQGIVCSCTTEFCVHQAQPCGPDKWMSKALRVGLYLLSKSISKKRKFCFYILAFTWIMSGLFRAWNSKYMSEAFLNQNWVKESYICGEQLSEKIAGDFLRVFFFRNIGVVQFYFKFF